MVLNIQVQGVRLHNVHIGLQEFRKYLAKTQNRWIAIAMYNGGPGMLENFDLNKTYTRQEVLNVLDNATKYRTGARQVARNIRNNYYPVSKKYFID